MAQERPNRLAVWLTLLRHNAPIAREQVKEWVSEVREEPRLLWETPAIRFSAYGLMGLMGTWLVALLVGLLTPGPPPGAKDAAVTADFHVVCADPNCGYNFVMQRKFGFSGFPVECAHCKKLTGVSGRQCFSDYCQGRWVAPVKVDDKQKKKCPECGATFPDQP